MKPIWSAFATAAFVAMPQMVSACSQLSENVWMCARGTAWETATWDQYGDGATILLDEFVFDFYEEFPGSELTDDLTTIQEQYVTYDAFVRDGYLDGETLPYVLRTDAVKTDHANAHRILQRRKWQDRDYLQTVMLTQVGAARIMLLLEAPNETPLAEMDVAADVIMASLRDSCADPVSCADDYKWPAVVPPKATEKE